MQYITFHENPDFKIAILCYDLDHDKMKKSYVEDGLVNSGFNENVIENVIAYNLPHIVTKNKKKPLSVAERREYLQELLEVLADLGIEYVMCGQSDYFKTLTGKAKPAFEVGTLCAPDPRYFKKFEHIKVAYVPDYKMSFYAPDKTKDSITLTCNAIKADTNNSYIEPGKDIINTAMYPVTPDEIEQALSFLLTKSILAVDIEAFSLHHKDAGLASISFAWSPHEGIAFAVDRGPNNPNHIIREMLIDFFFHSTRGDSCINFIWHNAAYDLTVLIYTLHHEIKHAVYNRANLFAILTDYRYVDDTKIIAYLATNSCAGNKLSLKELSLEFAGNYGIDGLEDVTKIPINQLLEYNLKDSLCTFYLYNKYMPILKKENQENIYTHIFLKSLVDVIDMQLNGMPVDIQQVRESKKELSNIYNTAFNKIKSHEAVIQLVEHLKEEEVKKLHAKWKKKRTTANEISLEFNPNSDAQLSILLYDNKFFGLPILGRTERGAPSTKGSYIKALKNHTNDSSIIELLDAIIELKDSSILLNTFIPALEDARKAQHNEYYMHGNFNLGGTVSGRLSSSNPNLQNLPSKSRLAKYIKKCIKAPQGWLLVGLDFDSLEDKISALLTKDPNKLAVYMGHQVYEVEIDGSIHHIREDDTINYDGVQYTGMEFYEKFSTHSRV